MVLLYCARLMETLTIPSDLRWVRESQDAQQITEAVMSQVQDGSIILLHDIFSTSVDAVEIFIPRLIDEGYQLVTIHELAKIKGTELQTGIAYGDFTGQ